MIRRLGLILGLLVLLALAAAWIDGHVKCHYLSLQTPGRWYALQPHRERLILVTMAETTPQRWAVGFGPNSMESLDLAFPGGAFVWNGRAVVWTWTWTLTFMRWNERIRIRRTCTTIFTRVCLCGLSIVCLV